MKKSYKSNWSLGRMGIFAALIAVSLSSTVDGMFSPAHAATGDNPAGTTITETLIAIPGTPLYNYGIIDISALSNLSEVLAFGMYASTSDSHNLTNSGSINVEATITNAYAYAYASGMYAFADGNHDLTNSGSINVEATITNASAGAYASAYASGMSAFADGNHDLTNSGSINVEATIANASAYADAFAYAYGMYARADASGSHDLTNSGSINVEATITNADAYADADASGMIAYVNNDGSHDLTNNGSINVEATITNADAYASAYAYGMYLMGAPTAGSEHRVENTGIITASATVTNPDKAFAYEVYGKDSYTVGTWATTLRTWTKNDAVFAVLGDETITFDGSNFIVRPGTEDEDFKFGQEYKIKNMTANFDNLKNTVSQGAALDGTIASASTEVDFLKATLTGGNDPNAATIRIDKNITSETTPGRTSAMQTLGTIQNQTGFIESTLQNQAVMRSMAATKQWQEDIALASTSNSFAITKPSASANSWQAFILPHISTFDNSKYNFDGDSMGFMGGINYTANDKFLVGMHFDLTQADSNADVLNMSSDINAYALGLHGSYTMQDWYINGQLTASINEADNSYRGNGILAGQADVESSSLYASLSSGYIWTVAEDEKSVHTLTPQIGLSYLMVDNDSYDVNWNIAGYNMAYDDASFDALYGNINMQWRSLWALENGYKLGFNADLGLRQNLSDDEFDTKMNVFGEDFTTTATEDATTITTGAGFELQKGNYGFNLNYEGAYGDEQTVHTGKFLMKMMF